MKKEAESFLSLLFNVAEPLKRTNELHENANTLFIIDDSPDAQQC